jgi:hypothetical protein
MAMGSRRNDDDDNVERSTERVAATVTPAQTAADSSAGVEEIKDVNEVRDCDKSGRLLQLTNCVWGN